MISAAVALVLAVLLRKRLTATLLVYFGVWLFVPYSAVVVHLGGGLHPATWFILWALLVFALRRMNIVVAEFSKRPALLFMALCLLAFAVLTLRGSAQMGTVVDQYVAPVVAMLILMAAHRSGLVNAGRVLDGIVVMVAIEAALGVLEFLVGTRLFYVQANASFYYWYGILDDRVMGTTAHPLVFAAVLASTIPLLARYRRFWKVAPLAVLLVGGVLVAEARFAMAVAFAGVVYLVVRSRLGGLGKVVFGAATVAAGFIVAANLDQLGVFERFNTDQTSGQTRAIALQWFTDNLFDIELFGNGGIGSSGWVAQAATLRTSFESFYMQLVVDVGLILALVFLGAIVCLISLPVKGARIRGTLPAALAMLILIALFSSLAVESAIGPMLFLLIGAASLRQPDSEATPAATATNDAATLTST